MTRFLLSPAQRLEVKVRARSTSAAALGRAYGVSERTIHRIIRGVRREPLRCVVCWRDDGPGDAKVLRFSLSYHSSPERSARGVGSIALCQRCWREHSAPRMQKRRARVLDKVS